MICQSSVLQVTQNEYILHYNQQKITEHASKIPWNYVILLLLVLEEQTLQIAITDKYQLSYNTH